MGIQTKDLRQFELGVSNFTVRVVPDRVRRVRDALALEGHRTIVMLTPVDTGRARANWQVSVGTPAEGFVEAFDAGGSATIARGAGIIAEASDPYSMIWIHNGVPYVMYLNDGTPPHVIVPVNAKALHWKGPNGEDVFAKRVNHPGTAGVRMLERTVARLQRIAAGI